MPDPLYSVRATQLFAITPAAGPLTGTDLPTTSDGNSTLYCSGFISDTAGTVTVVGKEGPDTPVDIPVLAGVVYYMAIRQFLAVSTTMNVVGFL